LEYIERGITHNKEKKQFDVKYPFLEDPREALTDNRRQAIAYATSLEKKLDKHQLEEKFDEVCTNQISEEDSRGRAQNMGRPSALCALAVGSQ
jgi:hypothetical protein